MENTLEKSHAGQHNKEYSVEHAGEHSRESSEEHPEEHTGEITEDRRLEIAMAFVVLILALTVFSGCHGWYMPQDQPKEPWEVAVDRFWEYVADMNTKVEEVKKNIQSSQLSEELDTLIKEIMADLSMYRDDLQNKLGPLAQDTAAQMGEDMTLLGNKLQAHLNEAKGMTMVYAEELQSMAEQNAEDVGNRIKTYVRKLKKRLGKDTEEIRSKMETYFGELHSRTTQQVESVRDRLEPYLSEVRQRAEEKANSFGQLLKTQTDEVREKLETRASELKQQLEKTSENLRSALEAKVKEFQVWFQPYADEIQEQLQTYMKTE